MIYFFVFNTAKSETPEICSWQLQAAFQLLHPDLPADVFSFGSQISITVWSQNSESTSPPTVHVQLHSLKAVTNELQVPPAPREK